MKEIKPRLISAKSSRSGKIKSDYMFIFIIAFALGIFIGMKIKSEDAGKSETALTNDSETPISQSAVDLKKPSVAKSLTSTAVSDSGKTEDLESTIKAASQTRLTNEDTSPANEDLPTSSQPEPTEKSVERDENEEAVLKKIKYTLQIGAFRNRELPQAEVLVNELKDKGYDAYITPVANSKGESWNLLKIGMFNTREEAKNAALILKKKERVTALVKEAE